MPTTAPTPLRGGGRAREAGCASASEGHGRALRCAYAPTEPDEALRRATTGESRRPSWPRGPAHGDKTDPRPTTSINCPPYLHDNLSEDARPCNHAPRRRPGPPPKPPDPADNMCAHARARTPSTRSLVRPRMCARAALHDSRWLPERGYEAGLRGVSPHTWRWADPPCRPSHQQPARRIRSRQAPKAGARVWDPAAVARAIPWGGAPTPAPRPHPSTHRRTTTAGRMRRCSAISEPSPDDSKRSPRMGHRTQKKCQVPTVDAPTPVTRKCRHQEATRAWAITCFLSAVLHLSLLRTRLRHGLSRSLMVVWASFKSVDACPMPAA